MLHPAVLRNITTLCHQHNIPVIIDEAHGAHLRFLTLQQLTANSNSIVDISDSNSREIKRVDALSCGADFVVQSSHKTLTALSQGAMLHLGKGNCYL